MFCEKKDPNCCKNVTRTPVRRAILYFQTEHAIMNHRKRLP
jgi:hypothetical protein